VLFILYYGLYSGRTKGKAVKDLWTADFPDPIVSYPFGYQHRVWIDHILLSPDMLLKNNSVR